MLWALYNTFGWLGVEVTFTVNGEVVAIYNASKVNGRWYALPHSDSFGLLGVGDYSSDDDNWSLIVKLVQSEGLVEGVQDCSRLFKVVQGCSRLFPTDAGFPAGAGFKVVQGVVCRKVELTDSALVDALLGAPTLSRMGIRSMVPLLGYHEPVKVVNVIDLTGGRDAVLKSLSANVRRKINRAGTNGIVVKDGGLELLNDFYAVYRQTIHRHGSFGLPKELFSRMQNNDIKAGPMARLFVAYVDGVVAGSALLQSQRHFAENNAFATAPEYNRRYTSYALHMAMMDYAIGLGCNAYSLGRSTPGSKVHAYKQQFGGTEYPLYYCSQSSTAKHSLAHEPSLKFQLVRNLIRLAPMWCSAMFDRVVAKRIY